ncbi:MAG: DUF6992 family protein [Gemmatimonadaceae bacterium]|uniref:DUF6992 family protein n=2 Tax=Gemmatimonas sp. TaxID=1962908 RepID=UPI00391F8026|nr:hypothetical protein [Gemmatimonadota bacterium]
MSRWAQTYSRWPADGRPASLRTMWADTLLSLEQGHLLRLGAWAMLSSLSGTALLAWLAVRHATAPMVRHFGIQMAAWGVVNGMIAYWAWRGLTLRDFAGTQRLLNILWLNTGLDVGYAAVGVTLAIAGWRWGLRLGAVGAGLAVVVQGLVLALLDYRLIALIGPVK